MTTWVISLILVCLASVDAFVPRHSSSNGPVTSRLNMLPDSFLINLLQKAPPDQAKIEFFFFFFAGSGALGIGAAQVPKVIDSYKAIEVYKGGNTLGGKSLECSPLATIGYPEELREDDVIQIINNFPTTESILQNGPKKSYMAKLGYLELEGFEGALADCNPLAKYAAFQTFTGGSGLATPKAAEQAALRWKEGGVEAFKSDLLNASLKRLSSFAVFALLILIVIDLVAESANQAFF